MTDTSSSRLPGSFDAPPDPAAIRAYLSLKDARSIALIAARMAPETKKFDPVALVDAAMTLQIEAEVGLARRRDVMVHAMNYRTLFELISELDAWGRGIPPSIDEDNTQLGDPMAGPALRRMQQLEPLFAIDSKQRTERSVAEKRAAADARSVIPRPSPPCDLEAVLRYVTNAKILPASFLTEAFIDWLSTLDDEESSHKNDEARFQGVVNYHSMIIAGYETIPPGSPGVLPSKTDHEKELADAQDILNSLRRDRMYRGNFKPGDRRTAGSIGKEAGECYALRWKQPKSVKEEHTITWLASDFHAFWKKHEPDYLRLHLAAEERRKTTSAQAREAGKVGVANREHEKWILRTKAFVNHLSRIGIDMVSGDFSDLVASFSENNIGLKDKKAIDSTSEYLGTLCTAVDCGWDSHWVVDRLKGSGVRSFKKLSKEDQQVRIKKMKPAETTALHDGAIPECLATFERLTVETIQESLGLLKAALTKGTKK